MKPEAIKHDFPIFESEPNLSYLDSASTTLIPRCVIEEVKDFLSSTIVSTRRGAHHLAVEGGEKVESARKMVAQFLKTKPSQISFQNSISSSVCSIALGFNWSDKKKILVSQNSENSIFVALQRVAEIVEASIQMIPVDQNGSTNMNELKSMIDEKTCIVALTNPSMGTGGQSEVEKIAKIAHDYDAILMNDVRQSIAFDTTSPVETGSDILLFSGNIGLMGPPGLTLQWMSSSLGSSIIPGILGGSSVSNVTSSHFDTALAPDKYETGILNIPAIVGLEKALRYVMDLRKNGMRKHLRSLAKHLLGRLHEIEIVQLYGSGEDSSILFGFNVGNQNDGINCHDIALFLDESNIAVRSGLLCSHPYISSLSKQGIVQVSLHAYNTIEDINKLCDTLQIIVEDLI